MYDNKGYNSEEKENVRLCRNRYYICPYQGGVKIHVKQVIQKK